MSTTRNNHYVPQWYQRGFLFGTSNQLHYLDLSPEKRMLSDDRVITMNDHNIWPTSKCFFERDLYTTFFGEYINDEIEKKLFGEIDNTGSKAVRAFISEDVSEWHKHFSNFFSYIDSQKIRTPKGLHWIKNQYSMLDQNQLMREMQEIRTIHCTIWSEGVREIISARNSTVKFILSDHPVTVYNPAYPPESEQCTYPNDPSIALKGTQTIFPLDFDHCLILTNYEYAKNTNIEDPTQKRTNARNFRNSMVRTDAFIRSRILTEEDIRKINFIIKTRARRYIAASEKNWLYPEHDLELNWPELGKVLLPADHGLFPYGGEMYVGHKDGSIYYQDAFGRTTPENQYLKKPKRTGKTHPNDPCSCGSGKKYKKCCRDKNPSEKPSSEELSIRERNLVFCNGIADILGLSKNKTWDDVRRELSNEQVKKIHELYEFLWPIETDLISLLPKPDKSLRALYTGIIDPTVTLKFATSLTLYFDEIIIQNPFINPASVRPKFSPVQYPHQYKQQTLKNVFLLLTLAPFIEKGYISFIPDLCSFDRHLQKQMFSMAEERSQNHQIAEKERELMEELQRDDYQRSIFLLPKAHQRIQFQKANPDLSEQQIDEVFEYIDMKKLKDPFQLLQDNILNKEDGQLIISNLTPNFEISLFISQITGSFLLTDSSYRWQEIISSQNKEKGMVVYNWNDLSNCIDDLEYILNTNPERTFQLRSLGRLGSLRKAMREIYSVIQDDEKLTDNECLLNRLKLQFIKAHEISKKEIGSEPQSLSRRFHCIIPMGGILHNNVQRMLLSYGSDNHLNNVPMAIFVEHI